MIKSRRLVQGPPFLLVLSATLALLATPAQGLDLVPCHLENHSQEVLCGSHTVFEDRKAGSGRQIDIHFAVVPAIDEAVEPDPLVLFAGGPGQAARDLIPFVRRVFSEVNERRDLVLIDQRGMGESHPLACEMLEEELLDLDQEAQELLTRELLQECLEGLDADVTLYTQDLANEDIHEILLALGYDRVNLFGASWGTRSALLFAHRYPEQVRTVTLDGNLPLSNHAPSNAAADGDRALTKLFEDCAADEACGRAFPELSKNFRATVARLGTEGERIELPDPTSGEPVSLLLTHDRFGEVLRTILYDPGMSRVLPLLLQQASQGDFRALMGVAGTLASGVEGSMTLGASLTIFCSEELARVDPNRVDESAERLLGEQLYGSLEVACDVWPKAPLPSIYREEVSTEAPTLLLSGDLDPITPPRWGEEMERTLTNALHLVAPGTGHNVAPFGCAADLIAQFIDSGSHQDLDGSCLEELARPSFFTHPSGPGVAALGSEDDR